MISPGSYARSRTAPMRCWWPSPAMGQAEDRALSIEAGFDIHLLKPVEPAKPFEVFEQFGRMRPSRRS